MRIEHLKKLDFFCRARAWPGKVEGLMPHLGSSTDLLAQLSISFSDEALRPREAPLKRLFPLLYRHSALSYFLYWHATPEGIRDDDDMMIWRVGAHAASIYMQAR